MKKLLLLLIPVFVITGVMSAQNEGYNWYLGTAPYNSNAAIAGSPGSYTLTTVGTGSITTAAGDLVGLGACGATPMDVAQFTKPVGLLFDNNPQFVRGTYTIEMVVNFADVTNTIRLLGFSGTDDGIYVKAGGGSIDFVVGGETFSATTINANQYYDLVFVRDSVTKNISFYQDGVFVDFFNDATDALLPLVANTNTITFLKDDADNVEEGNGKIAKISIYNRTLTPTEVATAFTNICDPGFQFIPPNFAPQGYQWTFGTAPFNSIPADGASTGSYPLSTVGSGSFSTLNTSVDLGASCVGNIDVAQYTKPFGFEMNNSPQFVAGTYSLEMVVNVADVTSSVRLVGFSGTDDGIYIDAGGGAINFAAGTSNFVSTIIVANTWYHLLFTRDSVTKNITYYQDGVMIGTFNDAGNILMPQESNGYNIILLKDDIDNVEEADGQIAKAAVFNRVLNTTQIAERFNNICNADAIILPVSLVNFTAKKAGAQVQLAWTTSTELNSRGFEVQRSNNGSAYTPLGFVNSVGNSSIENNYHFTDPAPLAGKNYYRLKLVDIDNRATYSVIRILDMNKDLQDLQLYPNPAINAITIVNIKAGNLLSVFDIQGKSVLVKRATNTQENLQVDLLSSGIYVLQVTDNDGSKRSIRFTKL